MGKGMVPRLRFPEFRDESGWESETLGKNFANRQEKGFSELPLLSVTDERGVIPQGETNRKDNSNRDKSKYLRVVPGDIAYNTMRMWEGRSAYVDREGLVSPAYTVCQPQNGVHGKFFSYYFKTSLLIEQFRRYSQGLVKDTLNLKYDSFACISVPSPLLAEQQKIVDCLESLDGVIASEGRKLGILRDHKRGLMQQLFPQPGQTQPRLRFPEFEGKGEWVEKPLGRLSTIIRGGSPRPIEKYLTKDPSGLNWLKIGDVEKDAKYILSTEEKVIPEALSKTREVSPGDFILSNSMSFGRPYLLKTRTCIHDGWIAITKIKDVIHHEFLYYAIMSLRSQVFFEDQAAGGGVRNLNKEIIKSLPVGYPLITEQQRIADCLTALDTQVIAQAAKIDALKQHRRGLMQQLFPTAEEP